jgi:hypothetical protein
MRGICEKAANVYKILT